MLEIADQASSNRLAGGRLSSGLDHGPAALLYANLRPLQLYSSAPHVGAIGLAIVLIKNELPPYLRPPPASTPICLVFMRHSFKSIGCMEW